ncbi:UDP-3-O-(3-hydroxymyristoyl)glucosamine N-acyltransferase [Fluviicola taffensis]|uniref:UDP-3-O-(3-hydroxymyristoyl) glucosamine N-acyltransferase, non-repeat region n=1 Tax=Fluviicola taffensis (strain DSM 16823 / NCIMB 13979 / RW262) TaxID=755732 RepID=F2ID47_FLUTR|nr:LpxD N-terminal domain-containing protein [Fluviicola taffensis]AEA44441.1 UDP-3-O-(3-hydroxymyristoyl) glucosamine N-acyltransferase, non-repeat region [Fluviicola taffensis DSM 16823]
MKIGSIHTIGAIAQFLGRTVVGDESLIVTGINEIHRVEAGDLVFVDHPKYYDKAVHSAATFILIDKEVEVPAGKALIISPEPFDDYNKLTRKFSPYRPQMSMTGENCQIAESAHLSPNCFIGHDVTIGENVTIHPGAYIGDGTVIEENTIIGPNAIIGHYAFYYKKKPNGYDRMHSCGFVYIEKNVEIGAGTTIDAGVSAITRIGEGTKIDNQVQIGHDTIIGKHCLIAAQVGIAGCVTLEDRVTMWGQVGCISDVTIGEGAVILAQSGISKSLEGGKVYFGSPCEEAKQKMRELATIKNLVENRRK